MESFHNFDLQRRIRYFYLIRAFSVFLLRENFVIEGSNVLIHFI